MGAGGETAQNVCGAGSINQFFSTDRNCFDFDLTSDPASSPQAFSDAREGVTSTVFPLPNRVTFASGTDVIKRLSSDSSTSRDRLSYIAGRSLVLQLPLATESLFAESHSSTVAD